MGKPMILVCDDEKGVRESFNLILRKDYQLKFATNAIEAVDAIGEKQPDLLIMDIKMPKIDGIYALREIKKIHPKLKVIILTGYRSIEIAKEATKLGAVDYILKPFDIKHVLATIKKAL
ncbi:MAG: response regulator [Candidatus Omnitrophota bacterium]